MPTTLDQIEALLTDVNTRLQALPTQLGDEQVRAIVNEVLSAALADENHELGRRMRFTQGAPELKGTKFARWGLQVADIEFLYDLQTAIHGMPKKGGGVYPGPSQELQQTFEAVSQAMYLSADEVKAIDQRAIDGLFPRIPKTWFQGADRGLAEKGLYWLTDAYKSATQAMDSAESGFGSQLIGAQYVGELWDAARNDMRVMPLIRNFEMTDPTAYLPVEVDFPEMLFVSESTANNSSNYTTVKTGSQRVQVDAKKFVIHQMWSGELEEDSIIPFVPFLRGQAALSIAHYSDSLVVNGDTTNAGTGNINLDDADPADTKHYLAWDGLRHVGIVDNTNNQKDLANVAVTPNDLVDALARMHDATNFVHWGMPTRSEDVVHLMDPATYFVLRKDPDVLTVDKMGPRATILTGQLAAINGQPIIPTQVISKTEADGKVSTTGGNNTRGQVVTFNRNGFVWGWRRRVQLETERLPATDQTRLVYSLRAGFGRFTPTGAASGIEAADVIFNIAV